MPTSTTICEYAVDAYVAHQELGALLNERAAAGWHLREIIRCRRDESGDWVTTASGVGSGSIPQATSRSNTKPRSNNRLIAHSTFPGDYNTKSIPFQ